MNDLLIDYIKYLKTDNTDNINIIIDNIENDKFFYYIKYRVNSKDRSAIISIKYFNTWLKHNNL